MEQAKKKEFSFFKASLIILLLYLAVIETYSWVHSKFIWKAENASVRLKDCNNESCELRGTLRNHPYLDMMVLTRLDGTEVMFGKNAFSMLTLEVPALAKEAK